MIRPAKGDIITAHIPPRLTAPEKKPRDQSNSWVIGTRNTDRVATDINGREVKEIPTAPPKTAQP
jgi:hypothetical protein